MNKYTGEVEVQLGDKLYRLVFDWRALAEIQSKHGGNILKELFNGISPDVIADVLVIGLKKHHPEVTKDLILDASPPFVPMVQAIDKALALSYFGADGVKKAEAEENQTAEDDKKKTT